MVKGTEDECSTQEKIFNGICLPEEEEEEDNETQTSITREERGVNGSTQMIFSLLIFIYLFV